MDRNVNVKAELMRFQMRTRSLMRTGLEVICVTFVQESGYLGPGPEKITEE